MTSRRLGYREDISVQLYCRAFPQFIRRCRNNARSAGNSVSERNRGAQGYGVWVFRCHGVNEHHRAFHAIHIFVRSLSLDGDRIVNVCELRNYCPIIFSEKSRMAPGALRFHALVLCGADRCHVFRNCRTRTFCGRGCWRRAVILGSSDRFEFINISGGWLPRFREPKALYTLSYSISGWW
ncbi:hypothetical protein SAMN05216212_1059 [Microbulbifer yueqingensis]|uniref:Uncharacterized protein n=1 Tax=Microbulbifer yueqingensis TaxID=658219 RepID=A0A1G8XE88_9GAMM|nr:hypothetical protein SAMN05216212_1059 [Microbulbifer yueqingensis]